MYSFMYSLWCQSKHKTYPAIYYKLQKMRSCQTIHLQNWHERLLLWVMAQSRSALHLYFLSFPVWVARLKKAWNAPNCNNLSEHESCWGMLRSVDCWVEVYVEACFTDLARVAADAPVMHVGHGQVSTHVAVVHRLENRVKRKTSFMANIPRLIV